MAFLVPVAVAPVACGGRDGGATASDDLIGGDAAAEGDLPGVIAIVGNCTAAKVGPRQILLAAHCVADFYSSGAQNLTAAFLPGATLTLTQSRANQSTTQTVTVQETFLTDTWKTNCAGNWTCSIDRPNRWASHDVALVVTTEDIQGIPSARVDLDAVQPGDEVTILGYGCEEVVGGNFDYSKSRLKTHKTTIADTSTVLHQGSFVTSPDDVATVDRWASITKGPALDPGEAGLCPGDSGGPLLRAGDGTPTVVGINSSYTFLSGFTGLPATNWHARVDAASGIGAFLEAHGVEVVHYCSEPGATCAGAADGGAVDAGEAGASDADAGPSDAGPSDAAADAAADGGPSDGG